MNSPFLWLGNHVALDFLNTAPVVDGRPVDLLDTFEALTRWLEEAGLVQAAGAAAARARWSRQEAAQPVLAEAHSLRDTWRAMVELLRRGKPPPAGGLEAINRLLRLQSRTAEIVRVGGRFERRFAPRFEEPLHLLVPLAEEIADFLCEADLALLRRCENAECVLYFYDTSKNHARRWCSMRMCGNRLKVAAHYRRLRTARRARR